MKKREWSEQLKRATTVIKADRLGVSAGIEKIVSGEVKRVLREFFSLSGEVETKVEVTQRGFEITVSARATSIKCLKVME